MGLLGRRVMPAPLKTGGITSVYACVCMCMHVSKWLFFLDTCGKRSSLPADLSFLFYVV